MREGTRRDGGEKGANNEKESREDNNLGEIHNFIFCFVPIFSFLFFLNF